MEEFLEAFCALALTFRIIFVLVIEQLNSNPLASLETQRVKHDVTRLFAHPSPPTRRAGDRSGPRSPVHGHVT